MTTFTIAQDIPIRKKDYTTLEEFIDEVADLYEDKKLGDILKSSDKGDYVPIEEFRSFLNQQIQ